MDESSFESQRTEAGRYNLRSSWNPLFAENFFHKKIHQQLSRLSRLQNLNFEFQLSNRAFLENNTLLGKIANQVVSLTKLVKLYLKNNNLTGHFPDSIVNLTSLEELYLSYNNLEGQVQAYLARLNKSRLLGFNLKSNLGNYFPNFQILYLVKCQFIGSKPSSLANASKLLELDFPVNNFTRNMPKGFGSLWNLLWLNVWSNQLGYGKHDDLDFVNSLTNYQQSTNAPFWRQPNVGTFSHSTVNLSSQLQCLIHYKNRISGKSFKVSVLGDMYSFGILILVIFTERTPIYTFSKQSPPLSQKVKDILDKTTGEMSKATNNKEYWGSIKKEEMECLVSILEIDFACSAESPRDRLIVTQVHKSDILGDNKARSNGHGIIKAGLNGHGDNVPKSCVFGNKMDKLALLGFKSQITDDLSGVSSLGHLNLKGLRLAGRISGHLGNLSLQKMPSSTTKQAVKASNQNLIKLKSLVLEYNTLVGQIPYQIGPLTKLVKRHLKNNNKARLFSGSIGNLTSFEDLSYNNLEGKVPAFLARLTKLRLLGLSVNNLSGEFPPSLYHLSSLELLKQYKFCNKCLHKLCSVSCGRIVKFRRLKDPSGIHTNVTKEDQEREFYSAASAAFLGNETDKLDLLGFKSQITEDLFRVFVSWNYSIHFCQCTETRKSHSFESQRAEAGRLSRLQNLNLSSNYLTGEIPVNLSYCVNVKSLFLEHNALLGIIPNQFKESPNFFSLIDQVEASWIVSMGFGNLRNLLWLNVWSNQLGYSKHDDLDFVNSLTNCQQSTNAPFWRQPGCSLTGTIPQQLFALSSLTYIYASYNSLTGTSPVYIGNWGHLTYLYFSHNNISAKIPQTLGKCLALGEIYLKGNYLQATIPNLKDLPDLQSVDLSQHKLSGPIPHFIASLTSLLFLNLSVNNLDGEVLVTGVFSNLSADGLNRNS
uniref:Leucine-rich repeat-containing N-terminal plant-type domain-containing protein n=1 Tax=Solanum lycopersicum TaxID=4081 RepID=A0A3Q7I3W6_SOLLC